MTQVYIITGTTFVYGQRITDYGMHMGTLEEMQSKLREYVAKADEVSLANNMFAEFILNGTPRQLRITKHAPSK